MRAKTTMMDLAQFIAYGRELNWPVGRHIQQPGFSSLYVRFGPRYIDRKPWNPVFTIASASATEPGRGSFKALIHQLRTDYPDLTLYLENVLNQQLVPGLARLGFVLAPDQHPNVVRSSPSFWLPGRQQ